MSSKEKAKAANKCYPYNVSDVNLRDADSNMRLYRGMSSPWGAIKNFYETYKFANRLGAEFCVATFHALRVVIPDYDRRQTMFSDNWALFMDGCWDPLAGQIEPFEDRFDIPPFLKNGQIRAAVYADKGDTMNLISGKIWYTTNDRFEKEIHVCDYDIAGPEACDLSLGGGAHFCYGLAGCPLNAMDPERIGMGDDYCLAIQETKRKYGKHPNTNPDDQFDEGQREWEVWGPAAAKLLDRVYVSSIGKLAPTRGRYTMMLTEEGIPQDDGVVFCLEENKYWISTLHCPRTLKELENHKAGLDVSFRKITKEVDMYAVQGPKAADMVKSLVAEDVSDLKRFQIVDNRIGDVAVKVAKAGYTSENGYEIYYEVKDDAAIEAALEKAAPAFGGKKIDEFGVMAYTLATEAGFYLITDLDEATPFETGIDWTIDWNKEDFLGKAAAEKAKALPKTQELVGITVDKEFTKVHGGPYGGCVSKNGKEIGRVTKFTYGFTAGKWVGFALVKAGAVQPGDHVTVDWDVDAVVTAERRFINT